ncbi:hypothetical protein [Rubrivivax gelatinosus]|uniref:hypothetical protein n=1 Tax=Rubrivivax gelatinosus TaxID=28068 RepID=UPI00030D3D63|nr:hypothetical protein [Rubrivivax gelatinosus]MBG6081920.1 hypothetical protein [Rubrivivax gelatinosus]
MHTWIFGGLAAASLAAAATVSTPIAGPLYACRAPAGLEGEPPVVTWADGDAVVVVPARAGQALPAYLFAAPAQRQTPPQRLRLAPDSLDAAAFSLTVPSGLALACEVNDED